MDKLTDQEVLATFMEPRPAICPGEWEQEWAEGKRETQRPHWWIDSEDYGGGWQPIPMDLDACHEIEARLTAEQWARYGEIHFLRAELLCGGRDDYRKGMLHATAEQKVKALAVVLRPIVEAKSNG